MTDLILWLWFAILLVLVAWVFWGCFRTTGMELRRGRFSFIHSGARLRGWVMLAVAVLGVVFGAVGSFVELGLRSAGFVSLWTDMVYQGVMELTMNGEIQANDHVLTHMARLSGVVLAVLIAYELVMRVFSDTIIAARLSRYKDHVVVCGLGSIGFELAKERLASGSRVVVVENDEREHLIEIERVQAGGGIVLIGDATEQSNLRRAHATRAKDVFFVTGSDEVNLEGASDLSKQINNSKKVSTVRAYIHLDHPELESVVAGNMLEDDGVNVVSSFNVLEQVIQNVMDTTVLDRRPKSSQPLGQGGEVAHFVIFGFGDVGERTALHIARLAHYENLRRSRVTIVHASDECERVEAFRRRYPKMLPCFDTMECLLSEQSSVKEWVDATAGEPEQRAWMPHEDLDDWAFGVRVANRESLTEKDHGVEFAVNGGFVEHPGELVSADIVDRLHALCKSPGV